jgi:cyclopropane fatty-acyl-phospholipid synthase-like methyltransferase
MDAFRRWLDFNRWYFKRPPWDTGVSPPELMAHMQTHVPGRALDLGCGTGTHAITMAQQGWQVSGVDFAVKAIAEAKHKAKAAGVQVDFRIGDVSRLDGLSGPFDLILDIGCFHGLTLSGRRRYAGRVKQLLAASGVYLMYAMIRQNQQQAAGIDDADLALFQPDWVMIKREDGVNAVRGGRPSAWFTWRRRAETDDE